jgi:hypothetical protein
MRENLFLTEAEEQAEIARLRAENERLRTEIARARSPKVDIGATARKIQAENPGMTFQRAWNLATGHPVFLIQAMNPGMSFEQVWNKAERERPELFRVSASGYERMGDR